MKKILSFTLAAVLVFGGCFSTFAADTDKSAVPADVKGTAYEQAVKNLMDQKILSGYPDGKFNPEDTVDRAEACIMVVKAMNPTEGALSAANADLFTDMDGYGWAASYIGYAVECGIVSGDGNGTFRPSSNVTYAEAAAMLINAMGYEAKDLKGTWPDNYVEKAKQLGLYHSVTLGASLSTKMDANRGNFANMLNAVTKDITKANVQPKKSSSDGDSDDKFLKDNPALESAKENIVPTMKFTGTPINLSLGDAIKTMQTTGPGYEAAILKKDATLASAQKSGESVKALRKTYEGDAAVMARDFLNLQAPKDLQADLNALEAKTVESYYSVLQAQDNLRIEQENLDAQQKILNNTQKKLDVGTAAKIDLVTAQTALESARSAVLKAQSTATLAKMNFNMQLGYPLMQNINLTDPLKQVTAPAINLESAVKDALNNRNELSYSKFSVDSAKNELDSASVKYPVSSATYKTAKAAYLTAQKAYTDAVKSIEMDVRNQYMGLNNLNAQIASAQATLENAKEGARITQLSYDAGLKTLTDVHQAQINVYKAELLLSTKITDYDLGVYNFKYASSVGTMSGSAQ